MSFTDIHRAAQAFDLRRGEQTGVIIFMPGKRQAEAFDRVGDKADRTIVLLRGFERVEQRLQIVPA
jgi:hypothetical protein